MFDKIKEAVSSVMGDDDAAKVEEAAKQASNTVDEVRDSANKAISDATSGGISADSLKTAAGELGGLSETLKAQTGELSGLAAELGSIGDLKDLVSGLSFPIQKDQVIAKLQESGAVDKIIALVKAHAGDAFNNPEELLGTLKGLTK